MYFRILFLPNPRDVGLVSNGEETFLILFHIGKFTFSEFSKMFSSSWIVNNDGPDTFIETHSFDGLKIDPPIYVKLCKRSIYFVMGSTTISFEAINALFCWLTCLREAQYEFLLSIKCIIYDGILKIVLPWSLESHLLSQLRKIMLISIYFGCLMLLIQTGWLKENCWFEKSEGWKFLSLKSDFKLQIIEYNIRI